MHDPARDAVNKAQPMLVRGALVAVLLAAGTGVLAAGDTPPQDTMKPSVPAATQAPARGADDGEPAGETPASPQAQTFDPVPNAVDSAGSGKDGSGIETGMEKAPAAAASEEPARAGRKIYSRQINAPLLPGPIAHDFFTPAARPAPVPDPEVPENSQIPAIVYSPTIPAPGKGGIKTDWASRSDAGKPEAEAPKSQSASKEDGSGTDKEHPVWSDDTTAMEQAEADLAYGAFQRGYYLTALDYALPRAESGDPAAQTLIGELYYRGLGVQKDLRMAANWYRFAAEAGDPEAQFAYANLLMDGKTLPVDLEKARGLLAQAAGRGHARAAFNLAQMIVNEKPDHAGFKEALPLYEIAAQADVPDAQYALANIYSSGWGLVVQDDRKARVWMERAAQGGLESAQVELGIWLANGKGGLQDEEAALGWLKKAAARGNAIAFNRLAVMYFYGIGTKSDKVKAASFHVLAKRIGNRDSELESLFQDLPEIDKKRAIELANRWRKL